MLLADIILNPELTGVCPRFKGMSVDDFLGGGFMSGEDGKVCSHTMNVVSCA